MAITIRILSVRTIPGQTFPPTDPQIVAEFAIQNDAVSSTWYKWSRGGIPANTSDVPAFLAAEGASLYSEAVAANAANPTQYPTMTDDQVNAGVYAWQHFQYRDIFDIASYLVGNSNFFNGTLNFEGGGTNPTVTQGRTDLQAVTTYLTNNLNDTPFERSFCNERFIAGVTGTISTKTAAELAAYLAWIRSWIGDRIDNANKAARLLGL